MKYLRGERNVSGMYIVVIGLGEMAYSRLDLSHVQDYSHFLDDIPLAVLTVGSCHVIDGFRTIDCSIVH